MSEMIKIRLRTKHGRTFRRFGQVIGPDAPTEFDVTPAQLEALKPDCGPVEAGGVLVLEIVETGKAATKEPDKAPTGKARAGKSDDSAA
jgi:hypothetical protein